MQMMLTSLRVKSGQQWGPKALGVAAAVCVGVAPVIATAPAAASTDGHVAGELIAIVQDSVKAALGGAAAANLGKPITQTASCLGAQAQSGSVGDAGSAAALQCFGTFSLIDPIDGFRIIDALPLARLVATLIAAIVPHDPNEPHGPQPQEPGTPTPLLPGSGGAVAPTAGEITSTFGDGRGHQGIDIGNDLGAPIVAVADGEVITSGPAEGFGLWMRIRHDDGTITTYGHNDENLLEQGARVRMGQSIATVGNRGVSTGPHLHFEVLDPTGVNVDPAQWLADRGVVLAMAADADARAPGPVVPQWVGEPRL